MTTATQNPTENELADRAVIRDTLAVLTSLRQTANSLKAALLPLEDRHHGANLARMHLCQLFDAAFGCTQALERVRREIDRG